MSAQILKYAALRAPGPDAPSWMLVFQFTDWGYRMPFDPHATPEEISTTLERMAAKIRHYSANRSSSLPEIPIPKKDFAQFLMSAPEIPLEAREGTASKPEDRKIDPDPRPRYDRWLDVNDPLR